MRLILIILLTFPLITISCIDKEFESELKFVQSIIDNPDDMKNIIENSEYYDSTYLWTGGHSYTSLSDYLRSNEDYKVRISNYYYSGCESKSGVFIDSVKLIIINCGNKFHMNFCFKKIIDKEILLDIGIGY
jgi:hypothetical protein